MNKLIRFSLLFISTIAPLLAISQSRGVNTLLTDMIDTSTEMGKKMLTIYNKYGQIGFSGYMQPQFQYASADGAPTTYAGGDFAANSDNRFRLRRGRLRADYTHFNKDGKPSVYFLFQFDGSERGVNIRDFWGRYYENKFELFNFTVGMFARPFGFEVLYSSYFRESPERGRMSQILMNTERDLGFMVSFNPRKKTAKLKWLNADIGIFNGQGLTGPQDYDGHKDIIARISAKKIDLKPLNAKISFGLSGYLGGIENPSEITYAAREQDGGWIMKYDSSTNNKGKILPRQYAGADAQLVFPHSKWQTEVRAEVILGYQTAAANTSVTPGAYPLDATGGFSPLYTRNFNGAYFWFIQNLAGNKNQFILKYDWYDPNAKAKGLEVDNAKGFTMADVRYNTLGIGYLHWFNEHLKVVLYYDIVKNENTAIKGFTKDVNDNIFTCRAQFGF